MTREELIAKLRQLVDDERSVDRYDPERIHSEADSALLAYIADPQVTWLYEVLTRWCA